MTIFGSAKKRKEKKKKKKKQQQQTQTQSKLDKIHSIKVLDIASWIWLVVWLYLYYIKGNNIIYNI